MLDMKSNRKPSYAPDIKVRVSNNSNGLAINIATERNEATGATLATVATNITGATIYG